MNTRHTDDMTDASVVCSFLRKLERGEAMREAAEYWLPLEHQQTIPCVSHYDCHASLDHWILLAVVIDLCASEFFFGRFPSLRELVSCKYKAAACDKTYD